MSSSCRPLTHCRACGSQHLLQVLSLGEQALTGVFPRSKDEAIASGPLELVWCRECRLLQLGASYDMSQLYGMNYGYRSGLNASMVCHLERKVRQLERTRPLRAGDLVIDVGSNDATTLKAYTTPGLRRLGVDPTGTKFQGFYPDGVDLIPDFFSAPAVLARTKSQRAAIVTSIAMFYDLEQPRDFVRQVAEVLAPDGIWHLEQSYMPSMLRMTAYDTVCHEHLEYYSLGVVRQLLAGAGLDVIDVQMNAVNGGSFAITAAHKASGLKANSAMIDWLLAREDQMGLHTPAPFRQFEERVFEHRVSLRSLVRALTADGKKVLGYGASTKGNVLLQFCGLGPAEIPAIADVNADKHGAFTPGTGIPIISEAEAHAMKPDYFLVLPWHFRDHVLSREADYLSRGGKFIFPLPVIEVV
jgi:hypothetical protein